MEKMPEICETIAVSELVLNRLEADAWHTAQWLTPRVASKLYELICLQLNTNQWLA